MSARFLSLLVNCFLFLILQGCFKSSWFLSSGLFSMLKLSCLETSSFDWQSILGEEHCETVSSSSENSEVEIVYGLKLLSHFAAVLSHSHPRAHGQLQYGQSGAVESKHLNIYIFIMNWVRRGNSAAFETKSCHRCAALNSGCWTEWFQNCRATVVPKSNLFYQLSSAEQKHDFWTSP